MRIIYISFIVLFLNNCYLVYEPVKNTLNRHNDSLIPLKEAQSQIGVAIGRVLAECPEYSSSGFNAGLNWIFLLTDSCDSYDSDITTGCSERDFVKKDDVDVCLASVYSMTCQNATSLHFPTYAICAGAIKSDMILPMMFF